MMSLDSSAGSASVAAATGQSLFFRRLQPEDSPALGDFFTGNNGPEITANFSPFPLTAESAVALLSAGRQDLFFAAESGGMIVGFSMLRGWDESYAVPSFGVFIAAAAHGRGIGRALTDWTLRWADQVGVPRVRLSVYVDNTRAIGLYNKLGFRESERGVAANGISRLIMQRTRPPEAISVYASTSALAAEETFADRLTKWTRAGVHRIECTTYPRLIEGEAIEAMRAAPASYLLHNYFPPPVRPLVLNLASPTPTIAEQSRDFYLRAINYSAAFGAKWFSLHAGFVGDPCGRDDFGFVFPPADADARAGAASRFKSEIVELAARAADQGIDLLVENNVCNSSNRGKLLLCTPDEFHAFLETVRGVRNIGVLLDTGHLAVSARTLGFDPDGFVALREAVIGMHLHDNDGRDDLHWPTRPGSHSLTFAARFAPKFVSLEGRYKDLPDLQRTLLALEGFYHARNNR